MAFFSVLATTTIVISGSIINSGNYIQESISSRNIMNCANVTVLTHGMGGYASDWLRKGVINSDDGDVEAIFIDEWTLPFQLTSSSNRFDESGSRIFNAGIDNIFYFGNGPLKKLERHYDSNSILYYVPEAIGELDDSIIDFNKQIVLIYEGSVGWGNDNNQEITIDGRVFEKNTDEYLAYLFTNALDAALAKIGHAQAGYLPKINLIGHSRGGLINLLYASQRPELVQNLVSLGTPYVGSDWASALFSSDPAYADMLNEAHPVYYSELLDEISNSVNSFAIGFNQTNEYLAGSLTKMLYDFLWLGYDDVKSLVFNMSGETMSGDVLINYLETVYGYSIIASDEAVCVRDILTSDFEMQLEEGEELRLSAGAAFWRSFCESPYYHMGPVRGVFEYVVDYCHSTASPLSSDSTEFTIFDDGRLFPASLKQPFSSYFYLMDAPITTFCGIRFRDGFDALVDGLINACSDPQYFCYLLNQYFYPIIPGLFTLPSELWQVYPVVEDVKDYDPIRSDGCVDTESQIGYGSNFRQRIYEFDQFEILTFDNSSDSYLDWFGDYYKAEANMPGIAHNFETKNREAIEDVVVFLNEHGGFHEHRGYIDFDEDGHWYRCNCGIQKNRISHDVFCNNLGRTEGHEYICSECDYRIVERHSYNVFIDLNAFSHISLCSCGLSSLQSHNYWYSYVGLVANPTSGSIIHSHRAVCRCGHSYVEACQYTGIKCNLCGSVMKPGIF